MASTYTAAGIELIAQGEQAGAWGDTTNTNWELVEEMVGGVVDVTLTGSTYSLQTTDATSSEGRHAVLNLTGSPGATCTITVTPNDMQKVYFVVNGTNQTATFTQGSGANVSVLAGNNAIIYCDGAGAGAAVVEITGVLQQSHVDLNTTAGDPSHKEGRIFYDNEYKALAVYNDESDITLQVGQEEYIRVYNDTGSTIANGTPVYITGASGETPTVAPADATTEAKAYCVGLATHSIENATNGYVTVRGLVSGFDTSGLTAGQPVHVAADGSLQTSAPTYPYFPTEIGTCIVSDGSAGYVYVSPEQHTFEQFRVSGNTHMDGNLTVDGDLTVNGTQSITSSANLAIDNSYIYMNSGDTIGDANTNFTGSGLDDAYFTGHYEGTTVDTYYVRIDSTGTPDTFEWSKDNFSTTEATGVAITGSDQALDNNISIFFNATTGHTLNDVWDGSAAPVNVDTGFFTNRNTGASGVGYTHAGIYFDVSSQKWQLVSAYDPEPTGTIDPGDGSFAAGTLIADTFEGNLTGDVTGDLTGNVTGDVTGNADTATTLETARTIGGVSFNGSANINLPGVNTTGNQNTTGSAATLTTARSIGLGGDVSGSASFDGSANITITATVADDSHNHVISNVDGLQTALDAKVSKSGDSMTGDLSFGDNDKAIFGLRAANYLYLQSDEGEQMVRCTKNDGVELFYNNDLKLDTTSTGIDVTGNITVSGTVDGVDIAALDSSLGALATLDSVTASQIDANAVGASELNVSGNGTTAQFLRSDGDGTFTWATPTDTNTTYSAGSGLDLSGTTFSIEPDLRDGITHIGLDSGDYIGFTNNSRIDFYVNGSNEFRMESDGDFHADGDVIAYSTTTASDERLKENIQVVENAVDKCKALRGVTFDWKRDGAASAGVIAQDVQEVLPEAVKQVTGMNGEDHLTVNYGALTSILIEAVKELSAKVKELEAKVG